MKTHKSTSKRFRRTKGGKGKLVRTRAGQGHFRRNKRPSRKRRFYQMKVVKPSGLRARVRRLLPNSGSVDIRQTESGQTESDKTPDAAPEKPEA